MHISGIAPDEVDQITSRSAYEAEPGLGHEDCGVQCSRELECGSICRSREVTWRHPTTLQDDGPGQLSLIPRRAPYLPHEAEEKLRCVYEPHDVQLHRLPD